MFSIANEFRRYLVSYNLFQDRLLNRVKWRLMLTTSDESDFKIDLTNVKMISFIESMRKRYMLTCARALVDCDSWRDVLFLDHGGKLLASALREEVGSPHLSPTSRLSSREEVGFPHLRPKTQQTTSFPQGRAGGQEKLVFPARPTLPP